MRPETTTSFPPMPGSACSPRAPDEGAGQIGGAILTFRYVQAGQRKSSILYLTPAMVARFANRG